MDLTNKKFLIVGLGLSGFSAARFLAGRGAFVKVTDDLNVPVLKERAEELELSGVKVEIGGHTDKFCDGVDMVIASPGIPDSALPLSAAMACGTPVIGELELGYRFCPCPVIAVTGTNGKSTTTEIIGSILSGSGKHTVVCGNIGVPLTSVIEALSAESMAVVEVSSFQLERIVDFRPQIAVLLNITEDHYERHGSFDKYRDSKMMLFKNQTRENRAIIHSSLYGEKRLKRVRSRKMFYGSETGDLVLKGSDICLSDKTGLCKLLNAGDVTLQGKHNLENIICALHVSRVAGIDLRFAVDCIKSFRGLSHRFQRIGSFGGVEFIDDSKATNIDAVKRALESMDKEVVLIAGGVDKGGDYSVISDLVRRKVKAMVLIGEAREKISECFREITRVFKAMDMEEAVEKARSLAAEGDAVLLSPMCSSFDMFSSYKERGEVFQSVVKELCGEKGEVRREYKD